MTKYEILKTCASVCEMLNKNGIHAADVRYVPLMEEFERMKSEGHKTSFIVYFLSQQYDIGEATIYRVIKKLSHNCKL